MMYLLTVYFLVYLRLCISQGEYALPQPLYATDASSCLTDPLWQYILPMGAWSGRTRGHYAA